jgi:hypothetical protein
MFRLAGTSRNVRILSIAGVHTGFFPIDIGTLVNDDSEGSLSGSGISSVLDGQHGVYDQTAGSQVHRSSVNPTTTDIPYGVSKLWHNTALGEIRHWTNPGGGTLYKSAAFTL